MKLYFSTCTNIIYINDDTINPTQFTYLPFEFSTVFPRGEGARLRFLAIV